ncbi:hypothetical protein ABFT80_27815 [Mesorhizobium sp. SB112]|uniref:hypothetical protein n=1 Tax=Mesorhizobium sp. SB112 TaxID=3151853 RepID=UPI003263CCFF
MPDIRHTVLIGAEVEAVYDAVSNQDGLSEWRTTDVKAKSKPHSIARFSFVPDYLKQMQVADLKPSARERLAGTWKAETAVQANVEA